MINREEILNFTLFNHLLRPDYLGVGTTGVESFQLRSCSERWLEFKSSLEKPSDKYQKTHIKQISFHGE